MKRLWTAGQSTLSQIGATVGQHMKMASGADQKAGHAVPPDKQYLRLPLESARKLRWFDKDDVAKLVKVFAQEKKELMDSITALKKLLIRAGFTDSNLDAEIKHILMHVEGQQEADEGVTIVLLAAAQAELETLQQQQKSLQEEVQELRQQLLEANKPQYSITDDKDGWDNWDDSPLARTPLLDPKLVSQLAAAAEQYERRSTMAQQATRAVHMTEQALHTAEQEEALALLEQQHFRTAAPGAMQKNGNEQEGRGNGRAPSPTELDHNPALLSKLHRLEHDKRSQAEQLAVLRAQVQELILEAEAGARSAAQVVSLEERCRGLAAQVEGLQAELKGAREKAKGAEEVAEKRSQELKRASANLEALGNYQDLAVETANNLSSETRRSQRAEARVTKLEGELKDSTQELRNAQKQIVTLQLGHEQLQRQLAASESALEQGKGQVDLTKNSEVASKLSAEVKALEAGNAALQRDLAQAAAQVAAAELRLQQSEQREAQLMAEVREAELVAAEREQLQTAVDALRVKLEESRAERGQLAHYKQVLNEAEDRRSKVEEELVATAQLVTQLEARLRTVQGQAEDCKTEAELADVRARRAESTVAAEVERRLQAAGSNRNMWPQGARDEVAQLEAKVEALQSALAAVKHQLESESLAHQRGSQHKLGLQRKVIELEDRCSRTEAAARERILDLEEAVRCAQQDAEAAHDVIFKLEQEMNELAAEASPTSRHSMIYGNSPASRRSNASGNFFKTHRVGGGGLLSEPTSAPVSPSSLSSESRGKLGGVDVMYLKNVLLKFIEAQALGKASERDALLPAIASILQATPKEFHALKQTLNGGSGTVFSALGIKL